MKLLVILLLLAQWSVSAATNFVTQIATNKIVIAVPEGYVELGAERRSQFPTNSPNALLGWFVRTNDLSVFEPNATNFLRHHLQVQTLKQWTNKTMSDASFAKFVEMRIKETGETTDSVAKEVEELFKGQGTNKTIDVAAPKQMGSFFKSDKAFGSLLLIGYTVNTKDGPKRVPMISGNAVVHVGNKCLFMYAFEYVAGKNELQAAMEKVRETLKPWVEATLKANEMPAQK
jgi:hypothetical protein